MAPTETRPIAVKVLSVGPHPDDHVALRKMLAATSYPFRPSCQFELTAADDVEGLSKYRIRVALCECELGKVTWRTLLARFEQLPDPPLLIVASRTADELLWVEALNLGADDVLAKPYRASKVVRTLVLAGLRWNRLERPRREEVA